MYQLSERKIKILVLLISAIQFLYAVDFMVVSPLAPMIANSLKFQYQYIGIVFGSFTLAAAISGIISHRYLDRYDRKIIILYSLVLMSLFTLCYSLSLNIGMLILFRFLAGLASGPCSAMLITIIIELVPLEKRGRALGTVMSSFGLGTVLGVPFCIYLSSVANWRVSLTAAACFGFIIAFCINKIFPNMTQHINNIQLEVTEKIYLKPTNLYSWILAFLSMMSAGLILQIIGTLMIANHDISDKALGLYYLIGGIASIALAKLCGYSIDKFGTSKVLNIFSSIWILAILGLFILQIKTTPIVLFTTLMGTAPAIGVVIQRIASNIPKAKERGLFFAIFNTFINLGATGAGLLISIFIQEQTNKQILGTGTVGVISILLSLLVLLVVYLFKVNINNRVERNLC